MDLLWSSSIKKNLKCSWYLAMSMSFDVSLKDLYFSTEIVHTSS